MTIAQTQWADISSLANNIQEGAVFTLRADNVIARTITVYNNFAGMNPRKLYSLGAANPRSLAEGEDMASTQFTKALAATLTPARHGDQFLLTDERISSDWDNVRVQAAQELGDSTATYVDTLLAGLFPSLTGGTIWPASGTITWSHLAAAKALLKQAKVPEPYFCVLAEGQWYGLINNGGSVNNAFTYAQSFNNDVIQRYYVTSLLGGVIFTTSGNLSGASGTAAVGAMYSPMAMAYDERDPYNIEPQRDASKGAWELNSNLRFAYGTWLPTRGIQLKGTDVIPTT
jgi:hypothetical protein